MSPDTLINKLEALEIIDRKLIEKLRAQVGAADKPVKATSILRYLVKNNLITETEAEKLLQADGAVVSEIIDVAPESVEAVPEKVEWAESSVADEQEVSAIEKSLFGEGELSVAPLETLEESLAKPTVLQETSKPRKTQKPEPESESALSVFRKNDQKNQWQSKWPLIGSGLLILVTMLVGFLSFWWAGASAEKQYDAALKSLKNSTFGDAVKKFDEFIKSNPSDKNFDQAKSYRVQAVMRSTFSAKQWAETIEQGQELLPPLAAETDNKLASIRDDIGYILVESLYHESETAAALKELPQMEESKRKLEDFWTFVDNPLYLSTTTRKGQTVSNLLAQIENNRSTISGLIEKEKAYTRTMAEIEEKGNARQTDEAFETYIHLIRAYPDLAARLALRESMKKISDAERELVVPLDTEIAVTTQPYGRTSNVTRVALAATNGESVNGLRGESVATLADGAVYGFDASTGEMRWRTFVGLETPFNPQVIDADTVLVSDFLRNEVSRVRVHDGAVVWRAQIEERFHEPSLSETQVVVTTPSGRVLVLDLQTGQMVGGSKIPQATNTGGLLANRLPIIYQTGSYSNLYAISTTTFDCKSVLYLGHSRNSIAVPPISWSGYLVVVRNGGDFADLLVLKPDKTGLNLQTVQVINRITDAPILTRIRYFGRGLLLFADNGDMRVLELNPGNETNPVSVRAKKRFDTDGQNAYVALQGTKVWAAGKGLRRYRVQRSLGQFKNEEVVEPGDTFLAPPIVLGDQLFHVRRRLGSGMVSASMVDARSLLPIWRTDFGGAVAGVIGKGGRPTAVSNQGDVFPIDGRAMQTGIALKAVIASDVIENLSFDKVFDMGPSLFAVSGNQSSDLLSYELGAESSRLLKMGIEPSDSLAHTPLLMGDKLLVATRRGQVAKLDLESGRPDGSPFLPPVSPGMIVPWQPLLQIGIDQYVAAHSEIRSDRGTTSSTMYFLSTEDRQSVQKRGALELEKSLVSPMVFSNGSIYSVVAGNRSDELMIVSTMGPPVVEQVQSLEARLVAGPWLAGDTILLQTDQDELVGFDLGLQRQWSIQIGNVSLAGAPQFRGGEIMITLASGMLVAIDPQSGAHRVAIDLQQPLAGPPVFVGDRLMFPGSDGTLHLLDSAAIQ